MSDKAQVRMPKLPTGEFPEGLHISQIELVNAIFKYLGKRHKMKYMPIPRRFNAIIDAANTIVAAFRDPERGVEPGMGWPAWMSSDHAGASSKFMLHVFVGVQFGAEIDGKPHPRDPSDFARCLGLLAAAPELRGKLPLVSEQGPVWRGLVDNWAELESLYFEEAGSGIATKLYDRMQQIIDSAQKTA